VRPRACSLESFRLDGTAKGGVSATGASLPEAQPVFFFGGATQLPAWHEPAVHTVPSGFGVEPQPVFGSGGRGGGGSAEQSVDHQERSQRDAVDDEEEGDEIDRVGQRRAKSHQGACGLKVLSFPARSSHRVNKGGFWVR
jgi:hypothetical protein